MCGVQDHVYDVAPYQQIYDKQLAGRGLLVLDRVENFHRCYRWS
jgi:polyketide biosynthesis 3-hydroxy-3-methylglutaryl-CoA synthase-like enzyme PksG